MLGRKLITLVAFALACATPAMAKPESIHLHLRIHKQAPACPAGQSPMSVEGVVGIFCVSGQSCVAEIQGNCPGPQQGLPNGAYCGRVKTGVLGCKPKGGKEGDEAATPAPEGTGAKEEGNIVGENGAGLPPADNGAGGGGSPAQDNGPGPVGPSPDEVGGSEDYDKKTGSGSKTVDSGSKDSDGSHKNGNRTVISNISSNSNTTVVSNNTTKSNTTEVINKNSVVLLGSLNIDITPDLNPASQTAAEQNPAAQKPTKHHKHKHHHKVVVDDDE